VLVAVQCGLYIGSERMIAAMLDQSQGDLWVVPLGTKSFDDPSLLIGHEKYSVLSTSGVADSEELVVGFAAWRKPKGGTTAVLLVGSDHENGTLKPWNIVAGSLGDLDAPGTVAVDDTYFADLGVTKNGDTAEINNVRVKIAAVTHAIRSFTTLLVACTGHRAFGIWPGTDPHAAVIWEAFKPESEPRRTATREEIAPLARQARVAGPAADQRDSDFLQREGGIY